MNSLKDVFNIIKNHSINIFIPLPKYLVFYELGLALSDGLKQNGINTNLISEDVHKYTFDPQQIYILYGAEIFNVEQLPSKFIVYQFEQLKAKLDTVYPEILENAYKVFSKAICIWDYSTTNIDILSKQKVLSNTPLIHVPLGYTNSLDYTDTPFPAPLLSTGFIGNVSSSSRRKKILEKLKKKIGIYENNIWNNSDPRVGVSTRLKATVIKKIDIGLIVYFYPAVVSCFDLYRVITLISNKCLVICERSMDYKMNKTFEPYIILCESFEIEKWIDYYTTNHDERKKKIEVAYQWLKTSFNYASFLPKIC
tara:strand:- start:3720 stop:4649 length:930 start_codon:yes stop_codon:yes gene_type:complete